MKLAATEKIARGKELAEAELRERTRLLGL